MVAKRLIDVYFALFRVRRWSLFILCCLSILNVFWIFSNMFPADLGTYF